MELQTPVLDSLLELHSEALGCSVQAEDRSLEHGDGAEF